MADFVHNEYTQAILHFFKTGDGSALVDAVAGSGKTSLIINLLIHLIEHPEEFPESMRNANICFVAFSKDIKDELLKRLPLGPRDDYAKRFHNPLYQYAVKNELNRANMFEGIALTSGFEAFLETYKRYDQSRLDLEAVVAALKRNKPDEAYFFSQNVLNQMSRLDVKTFHGLGLSILTDTFSAQGMKVKVIDNKYYEIVKAFIRPRVSSDSYLGVLTAARALANHIRLGCVDPHDTAVIRQMVVHHEIELDRTNPALMKEVINWMPEILRIGDNAAESNAEIDYTDMLYLPVKWELVAPEPYDIIFADEGQDFSYISRSLVLENAKAEDGRIFVVADRHQCQPGFSQVQTAYGWPRIISEIEPMDHVVSIDFCEEQGKVKYGRVEQSAKRAYTGPMIRVHYPPGRYDDQNRVAHTTPNHRWQVRFREKAKRGIVYAVGKFGEDYRVFSFRLVENGYLSFGKALKTAEAIWVLAIEDDHRGKKVSRSVGEFLRRFQNKHTCRLAETGDYLSLAPILAQIGLHYDLPFARAGEWVPCEVRESFTLQAANFIQDWMEVPIAYEEPDIHNGHVIDWVDLTFDRYRYSGLVYSLSVSPHETYIGDGFVTRNSIFGFAGADIDSVDKTLEQAEAEEFPLHFCYRCPTSHLELARRIVPHIRARDNAPEGELVVLPEYLLTDMLQPGDLVLCRVSVDLFSQAIACIRARKAARIRGKDLGEGLIKILKKIEEHQNEIGSFVFSQMEVYLDAWLAAEREYLLKKQASESALAAAEDKHATLIVCFKELGAKNLEELIEQIHILVPATTKKGRSQPAVEFSTVHRAKGLEADRVHIISPDKLPLVWKNQAAWQLQQEINLLYVAITRSKASLFIYGNDDVWLDHAGKIFPTHRYEYIDSKTVRLVKIDYPKPQPVLADPKESVTSAENGQLALPETLTGKSVAKHQMTLLGTPDMFDDEDDQLESPDIINADD